jgi:large subunit ribosomal protein L13
MRITTPTKTSDVIRQWQLIDVKDQIIGHVASEIANLLMGKSKGYYAKNIDCGDNVVVINSALIKSTGKKEDQKMYRKHSGFPGGFKEISLKNLRIKNSNVIVTHAVSGMVPDNKLKKKIMARLFVYKDANHRHKDKFNK